MGATTGQPTRHERVRRGLGQALPASAVVLGCLAGLVPTLQVLAGGKPQTLRWAWDAAHGPFVVELDSLTAFFLVPVLGLSALAAVYGGNYLLAYRTRKSLAAAWLFFGLFVVGMVLVLLAATAFLFLVAWEVMSLSAFFLVTFEHEQAEVRRAGWIYLIATHLGVAFLIVAFVLLGRFAGSLEFPAFRAMPGLSPGWAGLIFLLAVVGFGAKAGLVPFHVWLPEAHAAAPSHVSALMSGVMIKMGVYGLLRVLSFLGPPAAWWGLMLAALGLLAGLVGISLALHQRDLKRTLAYSSIENMGLIILALGIAIWGATHDLPTVAALGAAAALFHIWNHALMKGLMFFAAGSVLHGAGTRDLERLGGLLKRMPWTGSLMVFGAVAIAALPPLNGFVGKWLMYVGLLNIGLSSFEESASLAAFLAVGLLALIGGLAALAFVRLCGIALLGTPRDKASAHAHESSPWLIGPMTTLALLCLAVSVFPSAVLALLTRPLDQILGPDSGPGWEARLASAAPLPALAGLNVGIIGLCALGATAWLTWSRRALLEEGPTWGCGFVRPTPRIQYTGSSFSEMMAEHLLPRFLRPETTRREPEGLVPAASRFTSEHRDPVTEELYEPFAAGWADWFARLRILQQGKVHVYLFYILVMVAVSLAWIFLAYLVDGVMSVPLILVGTALIAVSGVPGLFLGRYSTAGQRLTTLLTVVGSALGLCGAAHALVVGDSPAVVFPWHVPGGEFAVATDEISAIFLVPVFLISMLGSIYGLEYWKQTEHPGNARKLRLFYGLLTAGMAMVVLARNGILFLASWEVMALSAYFLVTTEDNEPSAREAGWVYLVATHLATLCLFAVFALLRSASGSFALAPLAAGAVTPATATAIFALALAGFGVKAGIMPLHVWLPSAHAIAPSHVSALMSGVIIKMGIYGIVRVTSLLPPPTVAWGGVLLALGIVSGVLGVVFAIAQHDIKRLLAYHSIENIGIIVMGLGLALVGRSMGQADWVVLGLAGALLHVWNHALFKALLFLSAGSVIHAVHTREIDQLGGLAKAMPRTALGFLVGAVAICGLPPLNGFVSEFLIYLGLFRTLGLGADPAYAGAAFAVPALALIGALAAACFVKVYGAVFLGTARSEHAQHAHESGPAMLAPLAVLSLCCFCIGLAPTLVAPVLARAASAWAPELGDMGPRLHNLAPLGWVSAMAIVLLAALVAGGGFLWACLRHQPVTTGPTWGCGYAASSPRVQYTASSFAQMIVGLFSWVLRPKARTPAALSLFPGKSHFHSEVPDVVLDEAVLPAFRSVAWFFSLFRWFQQGSVQVYLLYIFLALLAFLLWQ